MRLVKNIIHMTFSVMAKIFSGTLLMIVAARFLGPDEYGRLMLYTGICLLSSILIEFGFSTYLVKEISNKKENLNYLMNVCFSVKVYLSFIYLILNFILFKFTVEDVNGAAGVYFFICMSILFLSISEFINIAYRGLLRFDLESKNTIYGSIIHILIVSPAILIWGNIYVISISYFLSRFFYLCLCLYGYNVFFGKKCSPAKYLFDYINLFNRIKNAIPYGLDSGIGIFRSNIDVVFVNYFLGGFGVGLYQAGMSIVKSIENCIPIFANVFLSELCVAGTVKTSFVSTFRKLFFLMFVIGLLNVSLFYFFDVYMVDCFFGVKYSDLKAVFYMFGFYIALRCIAVAYGVGLTALGRQKIRVFGGILSLTSLLISMSILVPYFELKGAVLANVIGTLCLIFYFYFQFSRCMVNK